MENIKYEAIKVDLDNEAQKYITDEAKDIRWTVSKLQSDISYYQYRIFLAQRKIGELDLEYRKMIGVVKDETTKNV